MQNIILIGASEDDEVINGLLCGLSENIVKLTKVEHDQDKVKDLLKKEEILAVLINGSNDENIQSIVKQVEGYGIPIISMKSVKLNVPNNSETVRGLVPRSSISTLITEIAKRQYDINVKTNSILIDKLRTRIYGIEEEIRRIDRIANEDNLNQIKIQIQGSMMRGESLQSHIQRNSESVEVILRRIAGIENSADITHNNLLLEQEKAKWQIILLMVGSFSALIVSIFHK